jgi:hypothetical protein
MKAMMRMATALALAGAIAGGCNAQAAAAKAGNPEPPKAAVKAKAAEPARPAAAKAAATELKTLTLTGQVAMVDKGRSKGRFQLLTAAGERLLLPAGRPAAAKDGVPSDPATSVPSFVGQQVRMTVLAAEHRDKDSGKVRLSVRKITVVERLGAAA